MKKIDFNDIRCLLSIANLILILTCGRTLAAIGLCVAAFGLCKDIFVDKKINGFIMHLSNIFLNLIIIFS